MSLQLLLDKASCQDLLLLKPVYHGLLHKRNYKGKMQWRYCVIIQGCFYYYENSSSKKAKGGFTLAGYRAAPENSENHEFTFSLECINYSYQRVYYFTARTSLLLSEWVKHCNSEATKFAAPTKDEASGKCEGQKDGNNADTLALKEKPTEVLCKMINNRLSTYEAEYLYLMYVNPILPTIFSGMSRTQAVQLLIDEGKPGLYLVRLNEDKKRVLSICAIDKCQHYIVFEQDGLLFIHRPPEPKFIAMEDLIRYYKLNALPGCPVMLTSPVYPR